MDMKEKLAMLEDILDVEEGSLSPDMVLDDVEEWDSLSALSYVVMMQDEFNKKMTGAQVRDFKTVQDILNTMEPEE